MPAKGIFLDFGAVVGYGRPAIGVGCDPRLLLLNPQTDKKTADPQAPA